MGISPAILDQLRRVFEQWHGVEAVWLFGSRAKGNFRPGSDIDFAVEGKFLSFADLLAIKAQLDDLNIPWTVDLLLIHEIDNPALRDHIRRVGVPFYVRRSESG